MSKAAQTVAQTVKILVPAGKATPSPPVGPALGARGVKAMDFCKEFNARTAHLKPTTPTPTTITINPDRTFTFTTRTPPVSHLLRLCAGIEKGSQAAPSLSSRTPGSSGFSGKVSVKQIYEIAKIKMADAELKVLGEERVARSVVGSARSLGLEIVP
ncbi:mitochondrial 54S ribosomal protein YmL19 [Naganishia albida]|nr:mitochondrial 54S ribosomal protein YmL19 [Naganishia albida]